jgi:hypothetical protein
MCCQLEWVRRKLAVFDEGHRQMAKILATVLTDGLHSARPRPFGQRVIKILAPTRASDPF